MITLLLSRSAWVLLVWISTWLILFVDYFPDRDARLKAMQDQRNQLESSNKSLQQEEQSLRTKYDQVS